nr:MAG TPA: hypothetical protein [Bacteriophage sp.]
MIFPPLAGGNLYKKHNLGCGRIRYRPPRDMFNRE